MLVAVRLPGEPDILHTRPKWEYNGDVTLTNGMMTMQKTRPRYVVDEHGRKTAVVLDVAAYEALLQHLEDLEDALELDEAMRSTTSFRPYREVRDELKRSGKL